MALRPWSQARVVAAFALLLALPLAASAQLKVMISGGFSGPYEQLLPEFERSSGIQVTTGSGSSQGTGPQTIAAQLARGVPTDVVILSREGLNELVAARRIVAGTDVDLARTPLAMAVRTGSPKPDVRTVEAFKQVVTQARLVAVPGSTSGIFLAKDVFPRLGIADKVRLKATPRGAEVAALVASGEADLAILPVSEIVHVPGLELAGVLPEEIQLHQAFAAAAVEGSTQLEGARRLIAFLASEQAAGAIQRGGMTPLGRRAAN
ncbi:MULTISPECIES: substrate-binding domain-containing protein [Ramlibacter]|nr:MULTISPECIES: substrate-binding domain-containing protein [Ramlibacter]MBA2964017.1 substrate-binding domain-containing protein [Ramlibacter sp. CGMCC 1.13660]